MSEDLIKQLQEENKMLRKVCKETAYWMANRSGYITSDIEMMFHKILGDESPWTTYKDSGFLARKPWDLEKFRKAIANRRKTYGR